MFAELLKSAGEPRCEVSFDSALDFATTYRSSLCHGGLFVQCEAAIAPMTPVLVALHLPSVSRAFELKGNVVMARPDGLALDLSQSRSPYWPVIDRFGRLCALAAEELAAEKLGTPRPQRHRLSVDGPEGWVLAFSGVSAFLRAWNSELALGRLAVPAGVFPPADGPFALRILLPEADRAVQAFARLGARGDERVLALTLTKDAEADLVRHVRLCEGIWKQIDRSIVDAAEVSETLSGEMPPGWEVNEDDEPQPVPHLEVVSPPRPAAVEKTPVPTLRPASAPPVAPSPLRQAAARIVEEANSRDTVAASPRVQASAGEVAGARRVSGGPLEAGGLVALLRGVAERRESGTLVLELGATRANVRLVSGKVTHVAVTPERPEHRLQVLLVKWGKLEPRPRDQAVARAEAEGVSFERALLDLEIMDGDDLLDALEAQVGTRLVALLGAGAGEYGLYRGAEQHLGRDQVAVSPLGAVFRALRDHYARRTSKEIEEHEAAFQNQYAVKAAGVDGPGDLELDRAEQRLWEQGLSGRLRLRDLYSSSPVGGTRATHGVVQAWRDLGYVELHSKLDDGERVGRHKRRYEEHLRRITGASWFDVLELHWMAFDREVVTAHLRLKEAWDWRKVTEKLTPDVTALSDAILKRLDEAREALSTEEKRRAYRSTQVERQQIDFAADLLMGQAESAEMRGDWRDACQKYAHVLELLPSHAEARTRLMGLRAKLA